MKKQMRKRLLSITLSIAMLITVVCVAPMTAAAESTADGLAYTLNNGEATISGYTGEGGDVVIPAEIDGNPVVAVGKLAFGIKSNPNAALITSLVVPESVKTIGNSAFSGCAELKTIALPAECTISSTSNLFQNCTKLEAVRIPSGVTAIGNYMFQNCSALEEITFAQPSKVLSTGMKSFMDCSSLKKIVFPDGVTTLGQSFAGCTALADVTIPASVTKIDATLASCNPDHMAIHCYKDSYAETFAAENGLNIIDAGALDYSVLDAKIAEAEIALGENADYYTKATRDALQTEVDSAKSVKENASEQPAIDDAVKALDAKIKELEPFAYKYAVSADNEVTITGFNNDKPEIITPAAEIVIPELVDGLPVTAVGNEAFQNSGITSVLLPASVAKLGDRAFSGCTGLKDVMVMNDALIYGADVFKGSENVVLYGATGSTTEKYAGEQSITFITTSPYQYILGDVNGDGTVNLADVLKLQNWLGKKIELANKQLLAGDIDANIKVEIADVLNIQKYKAFMDVEYPVGQEQTIKEEDIPDYSVPVGPTEPSSDTTQPSSQPTEPSSTPVGQMTLYVKNAVSWLTDDGCKLWAYNPETGAFAEMAVSDDNKYFSINIADSWQNIAFYRTTYDIDETTFDVGLPIEQLPNKWTGLPARGENDCFIVTADSAGIWGMYDPNEPSGDNATIYFDNSVTQWDQVYVYGWSFGLNKDFIPMEKVSDTIYKFTFPEAPAPGVKGFLFVNMDGWTGQQQTGDCSVEEGKNFYTNLSGSGTTWRGTWDVYKP